MTTITFTLPDGAVIGRPPTDDDVLGAAPGGVNIYGGSDLVTYRDAAGFLYVPYCGERPGRKFGTHCFRVRPDGTTTEWVELPGFTEGRAGVSLEPDGLWLSYPTTNGRDLVRFQVPGFVMPGFPSSGKPAPAPPPVAPVTPPAAPSGPAVDEVARKYTSDVKKELSAKIAALEGRIGQPSAGGLTPAQVQDHIWSKAPDAIYARLAANDAGLVGEIRRIVGAQQGGATMDRATVKALVKEVLLELLKD